MQSARLCEVAVDVFLESLEIGGLATAETAEY
jgi:hypothetical protein